ncbi:MAG: RluA family pseudouridine synthase [Ruthenibacterium sp.]
MHLQFTVLQNDDGMRLRDFLRKNKVSATLIKSVKQDAGFFCDGMPIHTDVRMKEKNVITFELPPESDTTVLPENLPITICYEDAHTMVLLKPAGQTVHPTRGYVDGTLANAFCGTMARRGTQAVFRPVNRLDRNTSGLVLCACNAYAAPLLARSVQKGYYAVIEGVLPQKSGVIDAPITLAENSLIKRCVAAEGKPSQTEYHVLSQTEKFSLVHCILRTGRTHQIRVHFAHLGHPLAGDDLYGGNMQYIARQALHCGEISFEKIETRAVQHIAAPLPDDFCALCAAVHLEISQIENIDNT